MTGHVCEVWAEQGWCPHTRPDLASVIANTVNGLHLVAPKITLRDGRRALESILNPFGGKS